MAGRRGGIDHVGLHRRAVAFDDGDLSVSRELYLRTVEMVVQRRKSLTIDARIPDDAAIALDQCDADADAPCQTVGFSVDARACHLGVADKELGDQQRLTVKLLLDRGPFVVAEFPRDDECRQKQRRRRDSE